MRDSLAGVHGHDDGPDDRPSPTAVVTAVGFGTMPLPFMAVYAVLFVIHGSIKPVNPPDITSSHTGELIAGIIALVSFIITAVALLWFLNARRRWPFAVVQLVILGIAIDFLIDETKGGRAVSVLIVVSCLVALVFGFAPPSWEHVGRPVPGWIARLVRSRPAAPDRSPALPGSSPPTEVEPASLRRRSRD